MSDFWIGDYVLIRSKGLKGRYHADVSPNKALVKINNEVIPVELSDLEITKEPELSFFQEKTNIKLQKKKVSQLVANEIDLHLEKLDPNGNISQFRMLDFQINACKSFLEAAIRAKYRTVLVIHGKGAGLLKAEVKHLLDSMNQVEFMFDKHKGGATEVWLKV